MPHDDRAIRGLSPIQKALPAMLAETDRAAQARRLGLGPLAPGSAPQPLTNVRDEPTPLSGAAAASGGRDPQGGH